MENQNKYVDKKLETDEHLPERPLGLRERLNEVGRRLANNVRLIDLYGRGKDLYKVFELIGPTAGFLFSTFRDFFGGKSNERLSLKEREEARLHKGISNTLTKELNAEVKKNRPDFDPKNPMEDFTDEDLVNSKANNLHRRINFQNIQGQSKLTDFYAEKGRESPQDRYRELNHNLIGDTLNFLLQWGISKYSANSERDKVLRTYKDLAKEELGIEDRDITFKDLKRVKNPIVRDAVDYYTKKALLRSLPDFTGLIRWVPKLFFWHNKELLSSDSKGAKTLQFIAEKMDGIKLLLGSKTFYFAWYFTNRQTGSFYQAEELWNKTEGLKTNSNRQINQNVLTGDFVNRVEIARLYEEFRKENTSMGMAAFTVEDPLTNRIFDQTARYLNHTYQEKIFTITEPEKGKMDMGPKGEKHFTHAMLVELVGSGGLRAEDALGSAIRLEVLATHGRYSVKEGIKKYREVSKVLEKIHHPIRSTSATQEQTIEEMRTYLTQIDSIGREYLGEFWPAKYINGELKEGFIRSIFEGLEISDEKVAYMSSAIYKREDSIDQTYQLNPKDPAAALIEKPSEQKREEALEAAIREKLSQEAKSSHMEGVQKKESFSQTAPRRDAKHIIEHPEADKNQAQGMSA